jgi:hypothetical protein
MAWSGRVCAGLQRWLCFALLALACGFAQAGRACENKVPSASSVERSMTLAARTAARLDDSGARVVVLARMGQNLSRYGLRYSHLGFAYRETTVAAPNEPGKPVWRVVHKLNQCGTAHSALYRQGLGEFFLDDLFEYEAALVVLAPEVQTRLLATLRDNTLVARLNTPAYNMLAYPWASTYQQSNQWAIETLAMTQDGSANTRERAQAWLRLKGYEPTTLHLSAFTRLGARATQANIAFDDHPNAKRFSDRIESVTVDSVFSWLNRAGLGSPVQVIR